MDIEELELIKKDEINVIYEFTMFKSITIKKCELIRYADKYGHEGSFSMSEYLEEQKDAFITDQIPTEIDAIVIEGLYTIT